MLSNTIFGITDLPNSNPLGEVVGGLVCHNRCSSINGNPANWTDSNAMILISVEMSNLGARLLFRVLHPISPTRWLAG